MDYESLDCWLSVQILTQNKYDHSAFGLFKELTLYIKFGSGQILPYPKKVTISRIHDRPHVHHKKYF